MSGYSQPEPIHKDHDVSEFSCGDDTLDEWLRPYALMSHAGGSSRCFVTCRENQVVGYYALASASVQNHHATRRVAHGMSRPIPAVLLGRLAVEAKEQGRGLGSHLLRDAILRTLSAAESVGVRVLLANALNDDAQSFYLNFGFEPSPTDSMHLMLLLKDALALLRE
ncbi:MAG: GNAT family N-acetyltransferase [Carbonactinosporaceae bacterium]